MRVNCVRTVWIQIYPKSMLACCMRPTDRRATRGRVVRPKRQSAALVHSAMFSLASACGSPAQQVLAYARDGAGTNTACYENRTTGVCWDLAACAVSSTLGDAPWRCDAARGGPGGGMCGAVAGDDYKKRPECYVWGAAVEPPAGSWGAAAKQPTTRSSRRRASERRR